jgi:hypothetical protein
MDADEIGRFFVECIGLLLPAISRDGGLHVVSKGHAAPLQTGPTETQHHSEVVEK